ncbi:HEAT repeat protein [Sandaracinus amylolyticus]|nr:HEAT repeat protein [Sandaracinus amylolyticus]
MHRVPAMGDTMLSNTMLSSREVGSRPTERRGTPGTWARRLVIAAALCVGVPSAVVATIAVAPSVAHAQSMSDEEYQSAMNQLRTGTPEERASAADVLGRRAYRQREQISPVLREMIRNDTDWRVRASAGRALGRLGTRDAVPDLVRALRDPVVDVRVVAAAAIWRLPDPAAVPALIELLGDADGSARQWAALALGVIRDTRATPALIRLLGDPEKSVRLDVIRSLGRIRDAASLQPLEAYVRDDTHDLDERIEAVSSLAALQGPEKVDALVRLLEHPSRDVRQRVIESLGQVGDALVVPSLRRRRGSEVGAMRNSIDQAITAIEQRGRGGSSGGGTPLQLPPG